MLNECKMCYMASAFSPFQGSAGVGNNNSGKKNSFCILDTRWFWESLSLGFPWFGFACRPCCVLDRWGSAGLSPDRSCFVWSWECREMGQTGPCAPVWTLELQTGPAEHREIRPDWIIPLSAALSSLPVPLQWTQRRTVRTRPWKEELWQTWVKPPAALPHTSPSSPACSQYFKICFKYF